jgi:hypothetical protein
MSDIRLVSKLWLSLLRTVTMPWYNKRKGGNRMVHGRRRRSFYLWKFELRATCISQSPGFEGVDILNCVSRYMYSNGSLLFVEIWMACLGEWFKSRQLVVKSRVRFPVVVHFRPYRNHCTVPSLIMELREVFQRLEWARRVMRVNAGNISWNEHARFGGS